MKVFLKYQLKEYFLYTFSFFFGFSIIITLIKGIFTLQKFIDLNPNLLNILEVFVLIFFQFIPFIYPLSAFMGVIFSIYRLKDEKELLAFYSLGFSLKDFLRSLSVFVFISFIITFLANFWLLPWSKRTEKIIKVGLIKKQINQPFPVKKPIPLGRNYILYVKFSQKKGDIHRFKRVFLLKKCRNKRMIFITRAGYLSIGKDIFELNQGWGFSLDKDNNLEVLKFKDYRFLIPLKKFKSIPYFSRGEKTFSELKKALKKIPPKTSEYYKYLKEYYSRLLYPFSIIFLILQAFLLGFWLRSSHKFLVFFIGIGVYLIFYLIYQFLVSLGENGKIYPLFSFLIFYGFMSLVILLELMFLKKKKGRIFL